MPAFAGAIEAADDVGHLRMRRDDAIRKIALRQEAGDELGGAARVAWRVRALVPHEFLQEAHEIVAVALDPVQQLLTSRIHAVLSLLYVENGGKL